jgi:hypothetical protein
MRFNELLTDAEFDPDGWGAVPQGKDIDYFGLSVQMRPRTFLRLAHPLKSDLLNPTVAKYMRGGGKIAPPFLEIREPEEWEYGDYSRYATVTGHEGRNRMTVWLELHGNDPVTVHLFLRHANRRRYITDDMIAALSRGLYSERYHNLVLDPFEATTARE